MKNKLSIILFAAIVAFICGFFVGNHLVCRHFLITPPPELESIDLSDSTINRALDMPKYCDETVVEANIREYFAFYFPNLEIIKDSLAIQDLGDCRYHVRLTVKSRYVRKTVILEYTYDYTFSKYFVKTLKESNY